MGRILLAIISGAIGTFFVLTGFFGHTWGWAWVADNSALGYACIAGGICFVPFVISYTKLGLNYDEDRPAPVTGDRRSPGSAPAGMPSLDLVLGHPHHTDPGDVCSCTATARPAHRPIPCLLRRSCVAVEFMVRAGLPDGTAVVWGAGDNVDLDVGMTSQ